VAVTKERRDFSMGKDDSNFETILGAIERQTEALQGMINNNSSNFQRLIDKHEELIQSLTTNQAVKEKDCEGHKRDTARLNNDFYGTGERCSMREAVADLSQKIGGLVDIVSANTSDIKELKRDFDDYKESTNRYIVWMLVGIVGFLFTAIIIPLFTSYVEHKSGHQSSEQESVKTTIVQDKGGK
jgi:hypothetical protein